MYIENLTPAYKSATVNIQLKRGQVAHTIVPAPKGPRLPGISHIFVWSMDSVPIRKFGEVDLNYRLTNRDQNSRYVYDTFLVVNPVS